MKQNELTWENYDGFTSAYHDESDAEINIEPVLNIRLDRDGTKRSWRVSDDTNATIAVGYADNLRAAKREAVAALAAHLAT